MVGLGVARRLGDLGHEVHTPLGVGEAAFLLGPHGRGQIEVRIADGLDVGIGVLHHQDIELLQHLADARRVRHRRHRIGGDEPEPLDLACLDRGKDIGLREPALLREELRIDAPEPGDLLTVGGLFEQPIAGEPRAGRPLTRPHGVALAGDREPSAPRPPDIAGDQVEIVDGDDPVRAVRRLVDAHRPDGHRCIRFGISAGDEANRVRINAADLGSLVRREVLEVLLEIVAAAGMLVDVIAVLESFVQDHVGETVEQDDIGAGRDRKMDVRHLGKHGHAWVDDDEREMALFARLLEAPIDHRMLLGQVRAHRQHAVGMLEVVVAARRSVGAERSLVAGNGRGHAKRGIAIVVVGADGAAHDLTQGVEFLRQELPGRDHREGVAPVYRLDALDLAGRAVKRSIPGDGGERR
jgi:hypothetical protein